MEKEKMPSQLKKRKRNKFGQQIDRYWRQRDVQRLIDKGVINTKIQMKEVKKLLDEIKQKV